MSPEIAHSCNGEENSNPYTKKVLNLAGQTRAREILKNDMTDNEQKLEFVPKMQERNVFAGFSTF